MKDNKKMKTDVDLNYADEALDHDVESVKKLIPVRDVMTSDCLTASPTDDPLVVAQMMEDKEVTCVVVVDAGKVVGLLTQMNLLSQLAARSGQLVGSTVRDCMSSPVTSVFPTQSIWEASEILETSHIKRLPVIEEGSLIGIVTQTDLIQAIFACGSFKEVSVIMSTDVATLAHDAPASKGIDTMAGRDISCVVICEGQKPVGLITERDILKRVITARQDPNAILARDIMTSPLLVVDSHYSIHSAACLMDKNHIHRLLVQDGDELKGIITRTDIFMAALKSMELEKAMARAYQEIKQVQSQLIQNEKLAAIGQMAAGVAHEMNTPVGFVYSNFQSLKKYMKSVLELFTMYEELGEAVENGAKEECLEIAKCIQGARQDKNIEFILNDVDQLFSDSEEGLERVTSIVQNLRDFSRVDQIDTFSEYDMNQGIESSLMVARNAIKYDADVELDLGDVPIVQAHGGQINQVILNICVNAAQAIKQQTGEGRGTITIKTYTESGYAICVIQDNGPGIAPEHLKNIFNPFYTTKPVGMGTGLGLSVSHDIVVNKHKGQLLVATEMGQGTTFTIKLPLEAVHSNAIVGM